MRTLSAVRDAAGLHHMAKQAEIGQVEAHRSAPYPSCFAKLDSAKY